MLFSPPRGLRLGRSSWNVLTAASEFWQGLRYEGHKGIILNVYVQDSVLFHSTLRLFRAKHDLLYDVDAQSPVPRWCAFDRLREFVVGIRCKAHGLHNSIAWGLGPLHTIALVDDAHIVIASLRNGSAAIIDHIPLFLARHVRFEKRTHAAVDVRSFWSWLCVEEDVIEDFVRYDPWWNGTHLVVDSDLEHDVDCIGILTAMVLYCCRWCQWSSSRWCHAHRSGCYLTRSLAMGIGAVVSLCLKDSECSNYYISGFSRLSQDIKFMMVALCFSAKGAEAVLVDLLEDCRFLTKVDKSRTVLVQHAQDAAGIPLFVWQRFGDIIGAVDARTCRQKCLLSLVSTHAYIQRDVFASVEVGIFKMTQGSIAGNVAALAEGTLTPEDQATRQVKQVLDLGEPRGHIVDMLCLLRNAPCTSALVEEGHASAAMLKRHHCHYSEPLLQVRALLAQQKALVSVSAHERQLASLDAMIERRRALDPAKRTHAWQAVVHQTCFEGVDESGVGFRAQDRLPDASRSASQIYKSLGPQGLLAMRTEACEMARDKLADIAKELEELCERRRRLIADEARRVASSGVRNHVRTASLSVADRLLVERLVSSPQYQRISIQDVAIVSPPAVPQAHFVQVFEEKVSSMPKVQADAIPGPWWCALLCEHRHLFHACAVAKLDDRGDVCEAWLFTFAKQAPRKECTFLRLVRRVVGANDDDGLQVNELCADANMEFEWLPPTFRTEGDFDWSDEDELVVLPAISLQGIHAHAPHDPMCFDIFVRWFPRSKATKRAAEGAIAERPVRATKCAKLKHMDAMLAEYPWLSSEDLLKTSSAPTKRSTTKVRAKKADVDDAQMSDDDDSVDSDDSAGPKPAVYAKPVNEAADVKDASEDEDDDKAAPELDMFVDDDVKEAVAAERVVWRWEEQDEMNFYTRVLGGAWLKKTTGQNTDAVAAFPRAYVLDWCRRYDFPKSSRATFTTYGREPAHKLMREWCRRAEYFFQVFCGGSETWGVDFEDFELHGNSPYIATPLHCIALPVLYAPKVEHVVFLIFCF